MPPSKSPKAQKNSAASPAKQLNATERLMREVVRYGRPYLGTALGHPFPFWHVTVEADAQTDFPERYRKTPWGQGETLQAAAADFLAKVEKVGVRLRARLLKGGARFQ